MTEKATPFQLFETLLLMSKYSGSNEFISKIIEFYNKNQYLTVKQCEAIGRVAHFKEERDLYDYDVVF